jgi:hypothetical protein
VNSYVLIRANYSNVYGWLKG